MGKIKKILVPNKIPAGTSFKLDEIVINPLDGKAYIKKTDNTVIELGSTGTGGDSTTIDTGSLLDSVSVTNNVLTFTNGDGSTFDLTVETGSSDSGNDNLGNHTATQDLHMAGFSISASLNITASGNISASGTIRGLTGSFEHIESDRLISHTGDSETGLQFASDTVIIEAANVVLGRFATNRITLGSEIDNSVQITGSLRLTGSAATSERTPLVIDSNGIVAIGNVDYNLLQVPSDGNYDDGLLPFTASDNSSTTISDAIDDINEVLAGLAPSAAPALDDINGSFSGVTANLSFGPQNKITTHGGYISASSNTLSSPDNAFGLAQTNTQYAASVSSNDVRIGVIDARSVSANNNTLYTTIIGTLNDDTPVDEGTFINHGADAFGNGDKGVLALFVNNNTTPVHTLSLSASGDAIASSVNGDGSGFINISATQSAHFISSGNELTVFKHRSGSFIIQSSSQVTGWNYARVEHQLIGSTLQTNYIEWVNEVDSASLSLTAEDITDFTGAGSKFLSGVEYFTSFTATYKAVANNVYKNVYSDSSTAIQYDNSNENLVTFDSHIATGSRISHAAGNTVSVDNSSPTRALPSLDTGKSNCNESTLELTASLKSKTNVACTTDGTAFTIEIDKIDHPFKTDIGLNAGSKSITDVLIDNRTSTSTLQKEIFVSESVGRIPSASYDTQTSATNAIGTFNSTASISQSGDLLVAPSDGDDNFVTGNGVLVYPNNIKNGNYAGLTNGPSSNVDYSTAEGIKDYYRIFKNESGGSLAQLVIGITGSATLVTFGNEGSSNNNISCRIKYPDSTGYLDLGAAQADGANLAIDNTPSNNDTPDTNIDSSGAENTLNLASSHPNFAGNTIANNEHVVMNLRVGDGFTGRITEIQINNF
jgi:hypothetical protein